MFVAGV